MSSPEAGLAPKGAEDFRAPQSESAGSNLREVRPDRLKNPEANNVFQFNGKKVEAPVVEALQAVEPKIAEPKNELSNSNTHVNKEQTAKHTYVPTDEYILPGADPRKRREAIEIAFYGKAGDPNRPLVSSPTVKSREPARSFDVFSFRTGGNSRRDR